MRWVGVTLLGGSLLLPPFFAGDFYINLTSQILIAAIFALSLNLLVGYGGMTSLGHASYLGVAAYISALLTTRYGFGHGVAALISISGTVAMAACFGVIALRASGLGFLMITLALSQVLWGLAYRMSNVTNGDNGIAGLTRPAPFGISLESPIAFYWFVLIIATLALVMMAIFVSSAFGSSLKGVRDQPRRMAALGFNPWLIRWITSSTRNSGAPSRGCSTFIITNTFTRARFRSRARPKHCSASLRAVPAHWAARLSAQPWSCS